MQALRKRNQALQSAKQRIKGKLAEGVSTSADRLVHTQLETDLTQRAAHMQLFAGMNN